METRGVPAPPPKPPANRIVREPWPHEIIVEDITALFNLMKKLLIGDGTLTFKQPQDMSITFCLGTNNNDPQGKLFLKDGKLHFEGDVDVSAKLFFDTVIKHWENK